LVEKLLKPAEFAEKQLLEAILGLKYNPGEVLPAERLLAIELGVTRPTLRETLQRLSKEGWITIRHGKPTKVNDYLKNGGLGILSSLARYGKNLSTDMVSHLLEVRTVMFPDIAQNELRGKSFFTIYKDTNHRDETLKRLIKTGFLKDHEIRLINKDGTIHFCSVNARPLKGKDGKPEKIIGIFRDISNQKKMEKREKKS